MDIKLDQDLSSYVEEKLKSGEFVSASAVVASAIRVMRRLEELESASNDELRRAAAEGDQRIETGNAGGYDERIEGAGYGDGGGVHRSGVACEG